MKILLKIELYHSNIETCKGCKISSEIIIHKRYSYIILHLGTAHCVRNMCLVEWCGWCDHLSKDPSPDNSVMGID